MGSSSYIAVPNLHDGRVLRIDCDDEEEEWARVACERFEGDQVVFVFLGLSAVEESGAEGMRLNAVREMKEAPDLKRIVFVNRDEQSAARLEIVASRWFAVAHPFKLREQILAREQTWGPPNFDTSEVELFNNLAAPAPSGYEPATVEELSWYETPEEYRQPNSRKRPRVLVTYDRYGTRLWLRADAHDVKAAG